MNSTAFTQNDIVLQLQLQSKPWKLLHTITDKTQVSFRQFACGDFHPHLKKKLQCDCQEKKYIEDIHGRAEIRILSSHAESISHEWAKRTSEKYFQHEKIKFISRSGHVISSIYPARTGINFPYFQLARRSFRFPSQLISQCHFTQLAQILHEGRIFCAVAPLGTTENNRRLHIIQKITKKSNDATQFAKLDS